MAIGQSFEEAVMKAVRGAEVGVSSLNLPVFEAESDADIKRRVGECTDQRIFAIFQALKRGILSVDEIHDITKIDEWFLYHLKNLCDMEKEFARIKSDDNAELTEEAYLAAKRYGYPDSVIEKLSGVEIST